MDADPSRYEAFKSNQDYSLVEDSDLPDVATFKTKGTIFRNNIVRPLRGRYGIAIIGKGGVRDFQVYNNIIYIDSGHEGIALGGYSCCLYDGSGYEAFNSVAYNNVIITLVGGATASLVMYGAKDSAFINNVLVGGYINFAADAAGGIPHNPTIKNNIIDCRGASLINGNFSGPLAADYNLTQNCSGVPSQAHSITGDPRFVDPQSDWHLQAGSPAIGAGTPVTFVGYAGQTIDVSQDKDGLVRATPVDLGVYEMGGQPPTTPSDTVAPSIPSGLTAAPVSATQINLSWSPSSDNVGVVGYRVFRGATQITTVTGTTFSNTGLSPSTTYSYSVSAYDASGNVSAQSSAVTATTLSAATPPPPASLLPDSYFKFDEINGGTASDSTGQNSVPLLNGATFVGGVLGNALSLDGIDDRGVRTSTTGLNLSGSVTIAAFVRPTALASSAYQTIVLKGDPAAGRGVGFNIYNGSLNFVKLGVEDVRSSVSITPGVFQHIAVTWDPATGEVKFFKDGQLAQSVIAATPHNSPLDTDVLTIGAWVSGGSSFGGLVDDLRLYGRALGSQEILDLSQLAATAPLPPVGTPADLQAPSVPIGVSATVVSQTQVNLAWNASTDNVGVTGYRVYRSGTQIGTSTTPSYSVTGLTASTSYSFTVAAVDAVGNVSSQSSATSATTQAAPDTAAPTVPGSLTATTVSQTQINLAWVASTDNVGVVGYRVYRGGSQVATTTTPAYSNTGLTAGTSYSFTVAAYDAAGNVSSQSSAASATTQAAPDTAAPSVPGGVSATVVSQTQINLAWTAATDNVGVTGYRVYQSGTQIGTSTTPSYNVTGLTAGTGYSFTVAAYDAAGNVSSQSGAASVTTQAASDTAAPTVPGSLTATAVSQTQVNLAWNVSTDNVGVAGYKVFQNGSQVATTTTAGYSQTGLTAGTSYTFTVSAYDAAGNTSGVSAAASATTQSPPVPPAPSPTAARTIELSPSNADTTCSEEFENTANTLRAGDTLVLHGGTYSQSCARVLSNLHGTTQQPIVIRAATGETPVLTRPVRPNGDYDQNNLEIADSSYVTIQGLVFRGGEIGVRLTGTNHHLTIENSEIADTGNAGFTANSGDTDALILRHNQIHHTGRFTLAATEGEGIYLGCNGATCRVTNSVIEQNYIHDLRGTSSGGNDGIEVKVGSGGNIVRHNVIHTTTVGTAYPCILVYGGGANPNTVEGNVVWQCGEAIVAVADATVRNNIVLQSNTGLASYPHEQVAVLQNVSFINNTVYGHAECASLRWTGAVNMVLANNALYCGGQVAIYAPGLVAPGAQATSNYVEGALVGVGIDGTRFLLGGTAVGTFANPAALDFWPQAGSLLRNTANLAYLPSADFNGLPRTPSRDVGAYATKGLAQNVGWRITPGFKVLSGDSTAPTKPRGLRVR